MTTKIKFPRTIPERPMPHPGELLRETLEDLGVTQTAFAGATGLTLQRVNEIVRGVRGISPETAWKLAGALNTSPEMWLNMQALHDLTKARPAVPTKPLPAVLKMAVAR